MWIPVTFVPPISIGTLSGFWWFMAFLTLSLEVILVFIG